MKTVELTQEHFGEIKEKYSNKSIREIAEIYNITDKNYRELLSQKLEKLDIPFKKQKYGDNRIKFNELILKDLKKWTKYYQKNGGYNFSQKLKKEYKINCSPNFISKFFKDREIYELQKFEQIENIKLKKGDKIEFITTSEKATRGKIYPIKKLEIIEEYNTYYLGLSKNGYKECVPKYPLGFYKKINGQIKGLNK